MFHKEETPQPEGTFLADQCKQFACSAVVSHDSSSHCADSVINIH